MEIVPCSSPASLGPDFSTRVVASNVMKRVPSAVCSVSREYRPLPRPTSGKIVLQRSSFSGKKFPSNPKLRLGSDPSQWVRCPKTNGPIFFVRASSMTPRSEEPKTNPVASLLESLRSAFTRVMKPLSDYGFGKRSFREGAVGLFLITGGFILALTVSWIKSSYQKSGFVRYQAIIEFSQACGIAVGTPVRIRGVDVGSVVKVQPSLKQIDVVVEMMDQSVIIPRNSQVEVNQSGLISETLIDITPRPPIPEPKVGPLDPGCEEEGLIVCDRARIQGIQGVSLDELVSICTKLAKQVDQEGIHNMFTSMRQINSLADDVKPLLAKVQEMTTEISPMLKELRQGDLLRNVENLTEVAVEAAKDLRKLNDAILTQENTEMLRESVSTLTKTLKHVESISKDVSGLTGDPATRSNLKQLIESLSRLVED